MYKTMTDRELREAAERHDRVHNEGFEGYNPYRDELEDRAMREAALRKWLTPPLAPNMMY